MPVRVHFPTQPWSNMRESKTSPSYNGSPVYVMVATSDTPFRLVDIDVMCAQIDFQQSGPFSMYCGDRNNQVLVLQNGTTFTVYNVNLKDYWFKNFAAGSNGTIHAHVVLA